MVHLCFLFSIILSQPIQFTIFLQGAHLESLHGTIKHITFRNAETGFCVLQLQEDGQKKLIPVVGVFPELQAGEILTLEGKYEKSKFGMQFKANSWKVHPPNDTAGIVRYLSSGLFKGIGTKTAEKIVDHFGMNTLQILSDEPRNIGKVPGFSSKKLQQFVQDWLENTSSREVLYFLHYYGIPSGTATRIFKEYGSQTIEAIKNNPYILCESIKGIGFEKADEIAKKLGIAANSFFRIKAALLHSLHQSQSQGHVYLPKKDVLNNTFRLLKLPNNQDTRERLPDCLEDLLNEDKLKSYQDCIYHPALYKCEKGFADWVKHSIQQPPRTISKMHSMLSLFEQKQGIQYDEIQKKYIHQAVTQHFFILTGGPGTGKTTTLKGILHLLEKQKLSCTLAAPTGRAARRMSELCEHEAFTLHRLLEYQPQTGLFNKNSQEPLDTDILIIDECSMVDAFMAYHVAQALSPKAGLILIGDHNQLPSVGAGSVLQQLLSCEAIPQGRLETIFRQSEASDIITNAHRINHGQMPQTEQPKDFHIYPFTTPAQAFGIIEQLIAQKIPSDLPDIQPFKEIQVLCPMKIGELGTPELNIFLQKLLNPTGASKTLFGRQYRTGDRIMQSQNNYDWNVFNGDTGTITAIQEKDKKILLDFEYTRIESEYENMDSVLPAYAMTIHKSQGSEYRAVIIVLDQSHHIMLQRNLLYTAVTRAKSKVYILAANGTIERCLQNNRTHKRYTNLADFIQTLP